MEQLKIIRNKRNKKELIFYRQPKNFLRLLVKKLNTMNWHSQGSIYGATIIGQVGLIFGRNWNGKQLDQIEKEYKGIFN